MTDERTNQPSKATKDSHEMRTPHDIRMPVLQHDHARSEISARETIKKTQYAADHIKQQDVKKKADSEKPKNRNPFYAGLQKDEAIKTDKKLGHRIYRLKGYTTVDKIERKFQQERHQRLLRNLLTTLVLILLLVALFILRNPFKDMSEIRKITGLDSMYGDEAITTSASEEPLQSN